MNNGGNPFTQSGTNGASITNETGFADHLLTTPVPEAFPNCSICDGTGYKDHAGFALDPCPHGDTDSPLEQIIAEVLASREHGPVTASEIAKAIRAAGVDADFQSSVDRWMDACFGAAIKADQLERADRFIEEALELAQTFPAFAAERAHALVDYVFARNVGEQHQEVGGVMVTLAALCNTAGLSIHSAAYDELARVWTKVEAIRAKQAAKPTGSALPVAGTIAPAQAEASTLPGEVVEMTREDHHLEFLKQMAAYTGPVVSFDFREPYYLASCDACGWVGSSELCGTDSWGGDSDVYCPRCQASGADCGKVADRIATPPTTPAVESGEDVVGDQALAAAARLALGNWLAWPDAPRDGPVAVTNEQVESWLHGLPNALSRPALRASEQDVERALRNAIEHLEHMAAHLSKHNNHGYSFESLGEDMPDMRAALAAISGETT